MKPTTRNTKADLLRFLAGAERDYAAETRLHAQSIEKLLKAQEYNLRLHSELSAARGTYTAVSEANQKLSQRLRECVAQRERAQIAEEALRQVPERIARAENRAREWGMNEARALATLIRDNRKDRWYNRLRRFFTW